MSIFLEPEIKRHTKLLLDSFETIVGKELIKRVDLESDSRALFYSELVVVSHGTEEDPIFNYANKQALSLWEMSWEEFTKLPSRYSAEPVRRELREKMLQEAKGKGYFDGYEGVRVSSSGKRFKIIDAIIWNLQDEEGNPYGQAATFKEIQFL